MQEMSISRVPKLDLQNLENIDQESVFKIASDCAYSERSQSTVSWGTDSSELRSLDRQNRLTTRTPIYPPWATHVPVYLNKQNLFNGSSETEHSKHGSVITDRVCSSLETLWRSNKNLDENEDKTPRNHMQMVTPRQLVNYSIRQSPGLVRPNPQNIQNSVIGFETRTNFTNRIWFTARLLVFHASDITINKFKSKSTINLEWKNSISSLALRTFTGIGFPDDSTWALYEDHKTGTSTKSLPFLRRNLYHCAFGPRINQPYMPEIDIFPGALLFVNYTDTQNVSEPLRQFLDSTQNVIRVLITGVDRSAQHKAIESEFKRQKIPQDLWYSVMAKLVIARLPLRPRYQTELFKLQAIWRQDLRQRSHPIEAYINLYQYYYNRMKQEEENIYNDDNNINHKGFSKNSVRKLLEDGLSWFRLSNIEKENLDLLWHAWEAHSGYDGIPHFTDYMIQIFGDLTESQWELVAKAFLKMDSNQLGHIQLLDLTRFYSVPRWALEKYGSYGIHSPTELTNLFKQFIRVPNRVEFIEFLVYYRALSINLGELPIDQIRVDEIDLQTLCTLSIVNTNQPQSCFLNENNAQLVDCNNTDIFSNLLHNSWGI